MALKDWKRSMKYNSVDYTMFINKLPKYKLFADNYYIVVGRSGNTNEFYMEVLKSGAQELVKRFSKRNEALAYAIDYMKVH